MKKVLFISHEASRTGAPLLLLHLLKWLNSNATNMQFDVLLIKSGAIADDFKKECTNTFMYSEIHKPLKFATIVKEKLRSRLRIKRKDEEMLFIEKIASNHYDLIYANTVVTMPVAVKIKSLSQRAKLLVHVHELDTIIRMSLPNFKELLITVDQFIATSNLVKDNLFLNREVSINVIEVIYPFSLFKVDNTNILKESEFFTVGASGNAHWRKGDDIFIQVANYVAKKYPQAKINFVWVGNNLNNQFIIESDIEKLGLKNVVSFVGEQANPLNYFRNFDVFLLTSREEPLGMVCIEAANLKKPIICFEKASGTAEIIKKGGGFVVPYLDIAAMGEKIMFYYDNPNTIKEDGEKVKELFAEFTPDKICPLLYEQINSLIKE